MTQMLHVLARFVCGHIIRYVAERTAAIMIDTSDTDPFTQVAKALVSLGR